jgi:Ca2+-binding RTX toxin-like protein
MSGTSAALESYETIFNQDLNGDGVIGPPTTASSSVLIQIAAATYTLPSNVQDVQLTGTAAQTVIGNSLGDVITSNDYGSTIIGGTGNDTLIAGHGADMLTGGGGSDTFVFNYLPWTADHITDFNVNTDVLDLRGIFNAAGYHGTNPVADGYLSFASDGAGDTTVSFEPQGHGTTIPILITTLEHVAPGSLNASDWIFH